MFFSCVLNQNAKPSQPPIHNLTVTVTSGAAIFTQRSIVREPSGIRVLLSKKRGHDV